MKITLLRILKSCNLGLGCGCRLHVELYILNVEVVKYGSLQTGIELLLYILCNLTASCMLSCSQQWNIVVRRDVFMHFLKMKSIGKYMCGAIQDGNFKNDFQHVYLNTFYISATPNQLQLTHSYIVWEYQIMGMLLSPSFSKS